MRILCSSPCNRRSQLLLPAGNLEKLRTAVLYGADAVYAGTPDMSLRTQSGFSLDDLRNGVTFAHRHDCQVYLTLNLFSHNRDVQRLADYVATLRSIEPDGVIVADLGVFHYLRQHAPELSLHVSTQANVLSWLTVQSWKAQGASLCVLGREVSFDETAEIRERCPDIRLETFIHGSMCMTYSGRCLLSNYMAERGANQGSCAHSCRWKYHVKVQAPDGSVHLVECDENSASRQRYFLEEEFRPGQYFPIEEDASGSYILNSRDLCLMPKLADYLAMGIDSLKVEGRNKSSYYVATVGRAYRLAIDAYYRDPSQFDPSPYLAELMTVASRGFTLGFHSGRLDASGHDFEGGQSLSDSEFAGVVREHTDQGLVFEVRNKLKSGDVIEFLPPLRLEPVRLRLYEFVCASTEKVTTHFNAGEGRSIRIPWSDFHREDQTELRALLPILCVARKVKTLTIAQTQQLERNRASYEFERGVAESKPQSLSDPSSTATPTGKAPKVGAEGCCGRGCNGCLPFWNDDKYAAAREHLLTSRCGKLEKPHP